MSGDLGPVKRLRVCVFVCVCVRVCVCARACMSERERVEDLEDSGCT